MASKTIEPASIPFLSLPSVPFTERKRLPKCLAIYFVLNAHGAVLYVGQSVNLVGRWAQHHRAADLVEAQATRIAWLVMADVELLAAVETACIAYFDPPYNQRYGSPSARPRGEKADYQAIMFRWPAVVVDQLRAMAQQEERTISAVVLRLLREALAARGQEVAVSEASIDTVYSS